MLSKQGACKDFVLASLNEALSALDDNGEHCRLSSKIANLAPDIALDELYHAQHSIELDAAYHAGFRDAAHLLIGVLCAP